MLKRKNGSCKAFYDPFFTFLTLENRTDWKLNQPMSPAFPVAFQRHIDLRCAWNRFGDISGKLVFHFPCVSFSTYISETLSRTAEINISLARYLKGE